MTGANARGLWDLAEYTMQRVDKSEDDIPALINCADAGNVLSEDEYADDLGMYSVMMSMMMSTSACPVMTLLIMK